MEGSKVRFKLGDEHISQEEVLQFLACITHLKCLCGASLRKIVEVLEIRQFGPGALIWDDQTSQELYVIWKGEVEVREEKEPATGSSSPRVLKMGDCFGTGITNSHDKLEITALDEVVCLFLAGDYMSLVSDVSRRSSVPNDDIAVVELILNLESLSVDLFRGFTLPGTPSFGNVYGGQLVGQALAAASQSVNPPLFVHSLHCYFLIGGDTECPIVYRVKKLNDGKNFSLRHVDATQKGRTIFILNASFQKPSEGLQHQYSMPMAPVPEEVPHYVMHDRMLVIEDENLRSLNEKDREKFRMEQPLHVRACDSVGHDRKKDVHSRQMFWIRARQKLRDDEALHRCVAAYASDWMILDSCHQPHYTASSRFKQLSLDHAMWFHKPFKVDEWLLFVTTSPRASNGRGLAFGHLYTQSGELVATVAQEGLFRDVSQPQNESRL